MAERIAERRLATEGGQPLFDEVKPVGQLFFPEWDRYEAAMRGIFARQYYINNGPLLQELEGRLRDFFGVRHAICTGNATFGLMMVIDALRLRGKVLLPSFTFVASAQALKWCGIEPVFCDIDPATHQIDASLVAKALEEYADIAAIMPVNVWGGAADVTELDALAQRHGVPIFYDSAHAVGCAVDGRPVGGFGQAEVFSFHATKVLSSAEGGCITTDDDDLAARLCGIRPSYGDYPTVDIDRVINSRMSEAQAAIALMNLDEFPRIKARNRTLFDRYRSRIEAIDGLRFVTPSNVTDSNYQYVVCEVDETTFGISRDTLVDLLQGENIMARRYFYPAIHRTLGFEVFGCAGSPALPVTERISETCLQLPSGARVDADDVDTICTFLELVRARGETPSETSRP